MNRQAGTTTETARLDLATLRRLLPFVAEYRGRAMFAMVLLLAAKGAVVAVPLVLRDIVDALDRSAGEIALPVGLLLTYGALRLSTSAFNELRDLVFSRVRQGMVRSIAQRVVAHLHGLSLRFHLERKTGAVTRDIDRGTGSVSTFLNYLLFNIVPTLLEIALVTTILVSSYGVSFALVSLATFVAYVVFTLVATEWRIGFRRSANTLESRASQQAIDSLLNYETVKYFGNERFELDRYGGSLREWEDAAVASQRTLSALNLGQGAIVSIGVTVLLLLAGKGVVEGALTLGDFVAVNAFLLQLFAPLGFLGVVYGMLKNALVDMDRLFQILALEPEIRDAPDAVPLRLGGGAIRFEQVEFAYQKDRPILRAVDFTVPAGARVAIVGPSGAGKSTIARLLYRFFDVSEGAVRIDDQDVRGVTQASLRQAIGIVPQDTVLFNDTLRSNLLYARLDATEEDLRRVLRMASLDAFIASLPDGLETLVGERGLKLSGGEKQRVAIARALLKDPPILIFDEATSSLDSESEQAIVAAMRVAAGRRTTLVVAHRLSTIVDADLILVLDDGRVVEQGSHAELLARDGLYRHLWDLQHQAGAAHAEAT